MTRRIRLLVGSGLLAIGLVCTAPEVRADQAADRATARALFNKARSLAKAKKYEQACPKFEEAQRLDPGMGTLFNLADCYENLGKTASAWSAFLEVASAARQAKQAKHEKVARGRAKALEAKLARVRIEVPEKHRVDGLELSRNGEALGRATWGTALPVDPGVQRFEAMAPGKRPWSTEVTSVAGETVQLPVPALQDAPEDAPPGTATDAPVSGASAKRDTPKSAADTGSSQRTWGLIATGVGAVGLGVGSVIALGAKGKFDDSEPHCDATGCDPEGVSLRDDAVSQGNLATVIGGAGLAVMAGGIILYLTAPSGQERGAGSISVRIQAQGAAVRGVW